MAVLARNIKTHLLANSTYSERRSPGNTEGDASRKSPKTKINSHYPKLKGFKVGHLNIASLPKHIEELKIFLNEISFDILCINETRLNNSIETVFN